MSDTRNYESRNSRLQGHSREYCLESKLLAFMMLLQAQGGWEIIWIFLALSHSKWLKRESTQHWSVADFAGDAMDGKFHKNFARWEEPSAKSGSLCALLVGDDRCFHSPFQKESHAVKRNAFHRASYLRNVVREWIDFHNSKEDIAVEDRLSAAVNEIVLSKLAPSRFLVINLHWSNESGMLSKCSAHHITLSSLPSPK